MAPWMAGKEGTLAVMYADRRSRKKWRPTLNAIRLAASEAVPEMVKPRARPHTWCRQVWV